MTSLSFDEDTLRDILRPLIERLIDEEWTRRFGRIGPAVTVVPVLDDDDDVSWSADDELPPLALTEELVPSPIPLIPSFSEAVDDAFDPSCVDDALQFAVPALQARPTPSPCCAPCTQTTPLLCALCTPTEIYTDTVEGSFGAVFSSVSWRFRDTG